ncbi:MAG: DNA polymerase III subunit delta [Rhodobacteraceae bacterium]|jgi:DNA polymerase-3 subunit delta|nr:DNA polymerase III subunit delta [Paracoccaceae bacterium]
MKLAGAAALRYLARPDPGKAGLLIHGADAMRVALRRQEAILALIGPEGEAEMRLQRMSGAELRKDPALLSDAMRAQGFFPGPRVAFLEDATDGLADTVAAALTDWRPGDASLVVTAGLLPARSALRKLFEGHAAACAIALYDDPPGREEIETELGRAGLSEPSREGMAALMALGRSLGPGDFRQTVEKLALYKLSDPTPASADDVAAVAPAATEAELDEVLDAVAEADTRALGPLLRRIEAQGVAPVTLCIGATRHFRQLHAAASAPGGPSEGVATLKPPVFGPRRDRIVRQAQVWGAIRLEQALAMLIDTDLTLRSASAAPAMATMERTLIRLAMLGAR